MSYIGTEPKDIRSFGRTQFDYTASQGQTAFTGADDDGKVLAFTTGQINVFVNGILMDDSDFTTTGTGTVTLVSAANLNDIISIVSFESNIPDNDYVPASGGTFSGTVTASNGLTVDDDGATPLTVDRATDNGDIIDLQKDGTSVANIAVDSNDNIMFGAKTGGGAGFYLSGSGGTTPFVLPMKENALSDNTVTLGDSARRYKDIYLGGGVYLGGTGAANKLDDYEIGTWTPTLPNGGTVTNVHNARYIKIGDFVFAQSYIQFDSVPNNSSNFQVSIPFPSTTSSYVYGGGGIGYAGSNNTNDWTQPLVYYSSSHFYFHKNDGTTATVKNNEVQGTWPFLFSIYYEAA